ADVLAAQPVTTNLLKFMRASIKMIGVSNLQSFIASMTQKLTLSDISDESKNYLDRVTEQSVRFQTALASIKLIQASAVLDLTEDDFDFLTSNKVWIATDRSRARRCVEACVYGTLDFVGYPRFPAPVEFIAAVIAYYV